MNEQPVVVVGGRDWWPRTSVAAYLGVRSATITRYLRLGMPRPERPCCGEPLWDPAQVRQWHESRPGRGRWGPRNHHGVMVIDAKLADPGNPPSASLRRPS